MGAQVALLRDDELVEVAVGTANAETSLAMTSDALVQVGSTTKVLTAVLVLQLAAEGRVDLDEPVGLRLRDVPEAVGRCTPRQLLSMTSGLDNGPYTDTGPGDDAVRRYVQQLDEPPLFPPGTAFSYSNASTCVSGLLVEEILGTTWDEALRTRVLGPAGMTCSTTRIEDVVHRRFAVGHDGGQVVHQWALPRGLGPSGSTLCSTAGDLVRFAKALPELLPPRQLREMHTPQVELLPTLQADHWGLGPFHVVRGSLDCWGHSGTNTGGSSYLLWVPSSGVALATVVNSPAVGYPFARAVIDALLPELARPTPEPAPDVAVDVARLVGVYRSADSRIAVSADAEGLLVSLPDGPPSRLVPLTSTTFLATDARLDGGRGWALAFGGPESDPATHLLNGFFALPRSHDEVNV
jgi:CubicO group peptidase (beta-lactamase class C family)